jgi:hypothetical protein
MDFESLSQRLRRWVEIKVIIFEPPVKGFLV